jgi:hypothetical protein
MTVIDVIGVRQLGGFKFELEFSEGTVGVRDFETILNGSMNAAGLPRETRTAG